jgi:acyl-coenzyme A synthetase/AMP-(fatty) acid ligase
LHIENLIENYHHLENFEIIQIQKNRCEACIQYAKKHDIPRLKIVHGVGRGFLKSEIHSLLKGYGLQFSDEYGSTEVIIS